MSTPTRGLKVDTNTDRIFAAQGLERKIAIQQFLAAGTPFDRKSKGAPSKRPPKYSPPASVLKVHNDAEIQQEVGESEEKKHEDADIINHEIVKDIPMRKFDVFCREEFNTALSKLQALVDRQFSLQQAVLIYSDNPDVVKPQVVSEHNDAPTVQEWYSFFTVLPEYIKEHHANRT
mmetsp:Transcript_12251/g.20327  ORF Transcript_12251/g.20327 Transcript_12251/m.20327 type:complete len:176 (-) Transcript_12251:142-669(-)